MNFILEKTEQIDFFTHLPQMLKALNIRCSDYDWYLSDIETNGFNVEEGWWLGSDLEAYLVANDVQFIWGVFSAVKIGDRPKIVESPYIYDNASYWSGEDIFPQMEGAVLEIASWDSSATIFVGLSAVQAARLQATYSDTKVLGSCKHGS